MKISLELEGSTVSLENDDVAWPDVVNSAITVLIATYPYLTKKVIGEYLLEDAISDVSKGDENDESEEPRTEH